MPSRAIGKINETNKITMSNNAKQSSLQGYLAKGLEVGAGTSAGQRNSVNNSTNGYSAMRNESSEGGRMNQYHRDMVRLPGMGRGGGLTAGRGAADNDSQLGAHRDERMLVDYDGEMVDIYSAPDDDVNMGEEDEGKGESKKVQRVLTEGIMEVSEKKGVREKADEDIGEVTAESLRDTSGKAESSSGYKGQTREASNSGRESMLAEDAYKLAIVEMEKELKKRVEDESNGDDVAKKQIEYWERKSIEVDEMEIGEQALEVTLKQKLRDYVEKNIKKCLLQMQEKMNLDEDVTQGSKRRKIKNANNEIIEIKDDEEEDGGGMDAEDISDDETVVTRSSAKCVEKKRQEDGESGWETVKTSKNYRKEDKSKTEGTSVLQTNRKYSLKKNNLMAAETTKKKKKERRKRK